MRQTQLNALTQAPEKANKKEPKEKKAKKSTAELSKDEETIKRLKVLSIPLIFTANDPNSHSLLISHLSTHAVFARSGQRNFKTSIQHHSR
jgi:hypothetical protein